MGSDQCLCRSPHQTAFASLSQPVVHSVWRHWPAADFRTSAQAASVEPVRNARHRQGPLLSGKYEEPEEVELEQYDTVDSDVREPEREVAVVTGVRRALHGRLVTGRAGGRSVNSLASPGQQHQHQCPSQSQFILLHQTPCHASGAPQFPRIGRPLSLIKYSIQTIIIRRRKKNVVLQLIRQSTCF